MQQEKLNNYDPQTVRDFGEEWSRFDQSDLPDPELQELFQAYFRIFPWEALPANAVGFDMGCGSGRWARVIAPRVGNLYCIDGSEAAIAVARRNPLSTYRRRSFYTMRTDALDRLGTRVEKRFTATEVRALMTRAGLERIHVSDSPPYWCAVGYRGSSQ